MKIKYKPKQSTNNKKRIMGDSNSRLVAGTLVGFILVLMSSVFYGMQNAYATTSSLSVSVTNGANPSVNVAPTADGRFVASSKTEFTVSTTHAAGYKVTASSTALTDNTNTISTHSVTSGVTASQYENNNYGSVDLNNTWGYLPSKICTTNADTSTTTCAANTLYLPAPTSSTQTLDEVSDATDNTYDINIGTRVATGTAQGAYATTFTVAVVGNATPYAITYNKNTTDTVNNMPTNHTTSDTGASGETVTLATNTPTRTGYTFDGWCTTTPTTSGGVDSCGGTKYSAGGSWALDQTSTTNSLTLYAMWNRASYSVKVNFAGSGVSSVQFAASGYTTRTVSSSGGAASLMYGVQYKVTMSFSSGYEFSGWALNSSSYGTLTSASTNPTYFTPNTSSASAIITATGKASCTSHVAFSGYMQDITTTTINGACDGDTGTLTDRRDNNTYAVAKINGALWMTQNLRYKGDTGSASNSMAIKAATTNVSADAIISYTDLTSGNTNNAARIHDSGDTSRGIWYNYAAASAMTITGSPNKTDNVYNLCPKNWTLPTNSQFASITSYSSTFSPIAGGNYEDGSLNGTSAGSWWSATAINGTSRYGLYYTSREFDTGNIGHRTYGFYIRCVHIL